MTTTKSYFRSVTSLLFLTLAFSLIVPSAFAGKPSFERIPFADEFIDESCGFPVAVQVTGIIVDISYVDKEGVFHSFQALPKARAVLTNLDTGKRIEINISGPGLFTPNSDGSATLVGTGNWLFFQNPDNSDEPGLFLIQGHFVATFDPVGNFTMTREGKLVNLCSVLGE